jgi:hypothetical protein
VSWLFFDTNPPPRQRICTIVRSGRSHTRRFVRQPEKSPPMPVRGVGGWLEAIGLSRHKPWQITLLRSSDVASERDEWVVETFEKAGQSRPKPATFLMLFSGLSSDLAREGAQIVRIVTGKATPVARHRRVEGN